MADSTIANSINTAEHCSFYRKRSYAKLTITEPQCNLISKRKSQYAWLASCSVSGSTLRCSQSCRGEKPQCFLLRQNDAEPRHELGGNAWGQNLLSTGIIIVTEVCFESPSNICYDVCIVKLCYRLFVVVGAYEALGCNCI